ncbi:hypothetical protein HA402_008430 [Bradysia odoriphaga]|nr:hypothetical protein HA402_008430 [Bradysia odoriphaga]
MEKYVQPLRDTAEQYRGKILFIALDTDVADHQRILDFFNIKKDTVPTIRLVLFVNGANKKYRQKVDDLSPESIRSFIQDGMDGKLKVEVLSDSLPEDWDKAPVKTLVGNNFEEVAFDANKDVFVSFYSPWSDDSKKLAPIFDELGEKYKDSETVVIAKFDATSNELDPEQPKIDSYPTLRLYKKGDNEVSYYTGQLSVDAFVKFIESGGEEITPIVVKETEDEDEGVETSEDVDEPEDDEYTFEEDERLEDKDEL